MEAATVLVPVVDSSLPDQLEGLFDDAVGAVELVERSYLFADRRVRVRYAGEAMFDVVGRAFGHLVDDSGADPELTIDVWDSASSRTGRPPLPASDSAAAYG